MRSIVIQVQFTIGHHPLIQHFTIDVQPLRTILNINHNNIVAA